MIEPPTDSPARRPPEPPVSAPLYTEIDAAELLERWSVLPNGAVAEGADLGPRSRRLASATDGFRALPFRFSEVRKYGSCVVFTTQFDHVGTDENGETNVHTETYHFIDCVGEAHEKNQVEGLFHTALACGAAAEGDRSRYYTVHIIRAGHFDPTTHSHPVYPDLAGPHVHGHTSIPGGERRSSNLYQWWKYVEIEGRPPILVNWAVEVHTAYYDDFDSEGNVIGGHTEGSIELFPFDRLHRIRELHFQIDHSIGTVKIEANDGAAFTEFQRRCRSLSN